LTREKIYLIITGVICLFGCAFLSIFNVIEANYSKAELIPRSEYHVGITITSDPAETESAEDQTESETININTATAAQLARFLPGIGEKKAENIIAYREMAGQFVSVDELIKVDGIGEKTLENIRKYCRVSD
jgi:competence protein ComEA helix-hairpin-helix repeat region